MALPVSLPLPALLGPTPLQDIWATPSSTGWLSPLLCTCVPTEPIYHLWPDSWLMPCLLRLGLNLH